MKKLLLLVLIAINSVASAQITITNSDMPSVDDTFRLSTTADFWGIDPTLTGTGYTWNYDFLLWASQDVDTFVSVGSTPGAYQFFFNNIILYPANKANYALATPNWDVFGFMTFEDNYTFYKNAASGFEDVGFGSRVNGFPMSIQRDPVDHIYDFPMDYTDTWTSYSKFEMNVPGYFYYSQELNRSAEVDGWGMLTTPYGTFQTLRVKMIVDITDSVYIDTLAWGQKIVRPTETQYHWLGDNHDVPLLQINTIGGINTSIIYKDSATTSGLAVKEELKNNLVSVYPNPVSDEINIAGNDHAKISWVQLRDLAGRIIYESDYNDLQKVKISTNGMASGLYMLSVATDKGNGTVRVVKE